MTTSAVSHWRQGNSLLVLEEEPEGLVFRVQEAEGEQSRAIRLPWARVGELLGEIERAKRRHPSVY